MIPQCKSKTCKDRAVFASEFCWNHVENKAAYKESISKLAGEGASFKGANLSRVDLSGLDLPRVDLSGSNLSRANLSGSNLFDANLKAAELLGADLNEADMTSADLEGSDLTRCSLERARLWHANLKDSNLVEANLSRADLWNANLADARFWRTDLYKAISLSKNNFLLKPNRYSTTYRINEKGLAAAEEAYRTLKKYFLASGKYNDASWASFKEKTVERLLLKKGRKIAYIPSLIMDFLCGYGEKPHRIILSSAFVVFGYGLAYFLLNAVTFAQGSACKMSLSDYLYYSVVTFTTLGYGDFIPKSLPLFRLLAASEAFIGAFMVGLFIFTLARRYSAR